MATKIVQVFPRYMNFGANPILKRIRHWEKEREKVKSSKFVRVRDVEETLPSYHPLGLGSYSLFSVLHQTECVRGAEIAVAMNTPKWTATQSSACLLCL